MLANINIRTESLWTKSFKNRRIIIIIFLVYEFLNGQHI